jgi:hypothetical protein
MMVVNYLITKVMIRKVLFCNCYCGLKVKFHVSIMRMMNAIKGQKTERNGIKEKEK